LSDLTVVRKAQLCTKEAHLKLLFHPTERRLRLFWRLIFFAVTLIVVAIFTGSLQSLVTTGSDFLAGEGISALFALLIIVVSIAVAGWLADHRRFAEFGFHFSSAWWRQLVFGLLLGAVLMVLIFAIQLALGWIEIDATSVSSRASTPFVVAIMQPIILFICVGIYEELLMRGYLLKNVAEGLSFEPLGNRGGVWIAYITTSLIFGVLHAGNPNATVLSTFNIAVAGLFLGLGMLLTGELAIPIGLHITWNFFQGNVFGMPVSGTKWVGATVLQSAETGPDLWTGGTFGPEAGLLGIIAMLIGSLATIWYVRRTRGQAVIQDAIAVYKPRSESAESTLPEETV
jgi:membrane protease YdiL (CAAX protease family)